MTHRVVTDDGFGSVYQMVERYYASKLARYGATPLGVDWSCAPTQELRFVKLLNVCDFRAPFSLNDIGCGYGALLGFLRRRHKSPSVDYLGLDLSEDMISQARALWINRRRSRFAVGHEADRNADYSVASGIFNVKLSATTDEWEIFIEHTLDQMGATSRRGFAANFLKILPNQYGGPAELYRSHISRWQKYCHAQYSAHVDVLEHHAGREFTLLVRY